MTPNGSKMDPTMTKRFPNLAAIWRSDLAIWPNSESGGNLAEAIWQFTIIIGYFSAQLAAAIVARHPPKECPTKLTSQKGLSPINLLSNLKTFDSKPASEYASLKRSMTFE